MNNEKKDQKNSFQLERFHEAQEKHYVNAILELKQGQKKTHWMWFIFPQFKGLGFSETTYYYSIKSKDEAKKYLEDSVLGKRLLECVNILLELTGLSASDIFGFPDDLKFKSSLTLFEYLAPSDSVFSKAINKYFKGERDKNTLRLLENE